jgi:hypothetical protein
MFFSVAAMASNNGYKLLSAQGMETLQNFLRDHGNECIRQFVQVKMHVSLKPCGLSHFLLWSLSIETDAVPKFITATGSCLEPVESRLHSRTFFEDPF